MATIDLHYFKDDLTKKPSGNSGSPPRGISAKDLDGNFWKVMVIEDPDAKTEIYTVEYTENGTVLKLLPTINASGTYVLGTVDGKIKWISTQDCDDDTTAA
jgi:hypothetical protein